MYDHIYEQLNNYCDCGEFDERDVDDMVNAISLATCWMQSPCETFLMMQRREVIDLPSCMDCPMDFEPFYRPFDPASFTLSLVEIKGTEETTTPLSDFAYIESTGVFRVDTGLPKCNCTPCGCGCETEYKLLVTYDAGYEEIPPCLLPVFCNLMEVIHAKNKCDCKDCGCEGNDDIKYATGDVVSVSLETDLGKILVETYKSQIEMISLCKTETLWGYVV